MIRSYVFLALLFFSVHTRAKVLSVSFESRDTILNGRSWGPAGKYELLKGKVFFGTDPLLNQNSRITDLYFAHQDERGLVHSSADLVVLKPIDQGKSKIALVEVSNRGGKFTPSYFLAGSNSDLDPDNAESFGDGLLLKQGVTIIWVGWQFDVPQSENLLNFIAPIAQYPEGTPIIGKVRSDWTLDEQAYNLKLGHRAQIGYPVYDPDSELHILTRRGGRNTRREIVSRDLWDFGRLEDGNIVEDLHWIYNPDGFVPGYIYELVYLAKDPIVVGLGLSALRDVISYAKYDSTCVFSVDLGIAAGVSQTGRLLRHFNYQGFNEDEQGRKAYDGMMIITAGAGRGSFNHRFAQPSRDAHRYSAFLYPTDIFPFTGKSQTDPFLEISDGILSHLQPDHVPKIFYINTGYEYWGRSASLIHTDLQGKVDISPLDSERIYHIASGQHFVNGFPPEGDREQNTFIGNPLQFKPNYRALLFSMLDWVSGKKPPPASMYPKISDGTLVHPEDVKYPSVPGIEPGHHPQEPYRLDYGPEWNKGIIENQPPKIGESYPVLVPQVDKNGNELGGIKNVELVTPLATYIPYSLRKNLPGGNGEIADFRGSLIPFQIKSKDVEDSRPTVDQLFASKQDYLATVRRAAEELIEQRFLLPEDLHKIELRSSLYWNWIVRSESSASNKIKIISFNIRYDNKGDGENRWDRRKHMVLDLLKREDPDFFGLQEALANQCKDVARGLSSYKWEGVGRDDGKKEGEYTPVFYNRKKWKVLKANTFWLSETPEVPSRAWDAALERIVTWVKFRHRESGKTIYVFNTHFDHRGNVARVESAKLLRLKIVEIAGSEPFLITGDFNADPTTEAYLSLSQKKVEPQIYDTKILSLSTPEGPTGTFSGFTVRDHLPLRQIDYIFCSKDLSVNSFEVLVHQDNNRYASDHFAVRAEITF